MNVISIQSQVAFGHVGNSAAVFPMQMHGIDVVAVPTTLLSNRPGYPTIRGRVLDAALVADLLRGIEERGAVDTATMILSGYLGSADNATVVADFVARAKAKNPALLYCCDPVLGDRDRGLFVHADIPPLVRDLLCPLADIITPNHFEFEWLCGAKTATIDQVLKAARAFMARGDGRRHQRRAGRHACGRDRGAGGRTCKCLARAHAETADQPERHRRSVCRALVSARVRGADTPEALSHAASAIFAVLERTAASATKEMRIVESAEQLVHPKRKFECYRHQPVGRREK